MLILAAVFLPWVALRFVKRPAPDRVLASLGLLPLGLSLLFYAEKYPAGRVAVIVVGAIGFVLFVRDWHASRAESREPQPLLASLVTATVLFAPLVYIAFAVDGWRAFGWHNLLQTEAIYSVFLNKAQDFGYSSHPLGYPYLGLLPIGVASRALDVAPTGLFLVFNFLALLVWVYSLQLYMKRAPDSAAARSSQLLLIILLSGVSLYVTEKFLSYAGAGNVNIEFRASPVTTKFIHLDAMTWGIASLSVQYYLLVSRSEVGASAGLLSTLFGLQTILMYPLLGPCSIVVAGMQALDLRGHRLSLRFDRLAEPVALTVALGAVLWFYATDPGGRMTQRPDSLFEVAVQFFEGIAVVAFVAALALFGLRRELHVTRVRVLLSCGVFLLAFAVLRLPFDVQYKFLYGMLIVLLFYAPAGLADLARPWMGRLQRLQPIAVVALMIVSLAFYTLQEEKHRPPLPGAFQMVESSWLIESPDGLAIKRALNTLGVSLENLVLLTDAREPFVPFLRIPQFYFSGRTQLGYSMDYELLSTRVKAYSADAFARRRQLGERILKGCEVELLGSEVIGATNRALIAVASDNPCRGTFGGSSQLRHVTTLSDGVEVFVEARPAYASRDASIPSQ